MKKIACIILSVLSLTACKKKDEYYNRIHPAPPVNIVLYNQPLDTIYKYMDGNWQLLLSVGGIAGTSQTYINTSLIISRDSIVWRDDSTSARYYIGQEKTVDIFGDTTYLLYPSGVQLSSGQVMQKIVNDTLYIIDNHPDGYTYMFKKWEPVY